MLRPAVNVRMYRSILAGFAFSALLALLSSVAYGGWTRPGFGQPRMRVFPSANSEQMGVPLSFASSGVSTTVFVGYSAGVAALDGGQWWRLGAGDHLRNVRSLAMGSNNRLWVAADGEVGYFTIEGSMPPSATYTSVLWRFANEAPFRAPHSVFCESDGTVTFVADDRLLQIPPQGDARTWRLNDERPTTALPVGNDLYFYREGEGIWLLTEGGPVLQNTTADIADAGVTALIERDSELLALSPRGVFRLRDGAQLMSSSALDYLGKHGEFHPAAPLPGARVAIGTRRGVAIVSRGLELVRVLGLHSGLPAPHVTALHVGQDGEIWIGTKAGVAVVDGVAAATRIPLEVGGSHAYSIDGLTVAGDGRVYALTNSGLHVVRPATRERPAYLERIEDVGHAASFAATPDGLLWSDERGVFAWGQGMTRPLRTGAAPRVEFILPPDEETGAVISVAGDSLLQHLPALGTWESRAIARLPASFGVSSAARDPAGGIWFVSGGDLFRWKPGAIGAQRVDIPIEAGNDSGDRLVYGQGGLVFVAAAGRGYVLNPLTDALVPLEHWPQGRVQALALSTDRRRLHAVFRRSYEPRAFGLATIELSARGGTTATRDWDVPSLSSVGVPTKIGVSSEDGADVVWIGGTEGLLCAYPALLREWAPPGRARMRVHGAPSQGSYPSSGHVVDIEILPAEHLPRDDLRLQVKFGLDDEWRDVGAQTRFIYQNLAPQAYIFSARYVNPVGVVGPVGALRFEVALPWYRTNLAYLVYFIASFITAASFIRQRERAARRQHQALEDLVRARTAELERANAAKDDFLAGISHEIRNPLNGVVALADALDESEMGVKGARNLRLLRNCANHLSSLLGDILDYSMLRGGAFDIRTETFSPSDALQSVVAMVSTEIAASGTPVRIEIATSVPALLRGDARRIRQVLLNYLSNALKYAGRGTVTVSASAKPRDSAIYDVAFAVSDEGPGIPPEEQPALFDKFMRGHTARSAGVSGAGMGLAVVKALAERMGGRAWVESERGKGSTFYFSVPLAVANEEPLVVDSAQSSETASISVLVVDDEEYNRIAAGALLEQIGANPTLASSAREAHDLARKAHFDLILLDYQMPGANGPEVARELRRAGVSSRIVAVTAYGNDSRRRECLAAGMDDFLTKPLTADALRRLAAHISPTSSGAEGPRPLARSLETHSCHLDNLRILADKRGVSLDREIADFERDSRHDLAQIVSLLEESRRDESAHIAHKLAGRLAMVGDADGHRASISLEQACRDNHLERARRLHEVCAFAVEVTARTLRTLAERAA